FHQTGAKHRRWYAEDHVVVFQGRCEIGLRDVAGSRIQPAGDHKQIVDPAIRGAVWFANEARLAHRTVYGDKRGKRIVRPVKRGHCYLRIADGTGTANCREGVAARATIRVEARPEP